MNEMDKQYAKGQASDAAHDMKNAAKDAAHDAVSYTHLPSTSPSLMASPLHSMRSG